MLQTPGSAGNTLKLTLDAVVTDKAYADANLRMPKCFDEKKATDAWHEDQEMGGPGLASLKDVGEPIVVGQRKQGATYRYNMDTWALELQVAEELMEDKKYDKAVGTAVECRTSMFLTVDVQAAQVFALAWDSGTVYGDGQPLCSASHPLPLGGTFSNTMATPQAPSNQAVQTARAAVLQFPGHHGQLGNDVMITKCIHPVDQISTWEEILKSKMDPVDNNQARINVSYNMGIEPVPLVHWNNTTTNYGFKTNATNGLKWFWRVRPQGRSWEGKRQGVLHWACRARWARGHSNPRGFYGVQA